MENRIGEPAANPVSLHRLADRRRARRRRQQARSRPAGRRALQLPTGRCCRRACRRRWTRSSSEPLFREQFGDVFVDYFLKLKRNEAGRFQQWLEDARREPHGDEPTEWEQNEYFDFF